MSAAQSTDVVWDLLHPTDKQLHRSAPSFKQINTKHEPPYFSGQRNPFGCHQALASSVAAGVHMVLMGAPPGSGKTTILSTLAKKLQPEDVSGVWNAVLLCVGMPPIRSMFNDRVHGGDKEACIAEGVNTLFAQHMADHQWEKPGKKGWKGVSEKMEKLGGVLGGIEKDKIDTIDCLAENGLCERVMLYALRGDSRLYEHVLSPTT